MTINAHKRHQTQQTIYDAFWQLYQRKAINQVTVKEITQTAGINRSTFYEYFADPYDVLAQLEKRLLPPLDNENKDGISYCLGVYEKNKNYFKVLLGQNGDPAFVYNLQDQLAEYFAYQLGSAVASDTQRYFKLQFVASGLVGVLQRYFDDNGGMTNDEVIALLQNMVLDGMHIRLVGNQFVAD